MQIGATLVSVILLFACGESSSTGEEDFISAGSAASGSGATVQSGGVGGAEGSRYTGFTGGDGGFTYGDYAVECGEPAPTAPVVCGGVTCEDPDSEGGYGRWSCVAACCTSSGGMEVCGAKDTTVGYEVECQPPPQPDTRCPNYPPEGTQAAGDESADGRWMEETLPGCCTSTNQCGVISSLRPLCITRSQIIDLPETPRACDAI